MIQVVADYGPCIALRREVFIDEQGISEAEEMDDLDDQAIHLLATDNGTPVGTARLLLDGDTGKIGRICVVQSHRGTPAGDHSRQTRGARPRYPLLRKPRFHRLRTVLRRCGHPAS